MTGEKPEPFSKWESMTADDWTGFSGRSSSKTGRSAMTRGMRNVVCSSCFNDAKRKRLDMAFWLPMREPPMTRCPIR